MARRVRRPKARAADYARAIELRCREIFKDADYCTECNWFAWKIVVDFCRAHGFGTLKRDLSADRMIEVMSCSKRWKRVTGADPGLVADAAIRLANEGKLVLAGMTSRELGQDHGHLAIVVRGEGQASGIAGRRLPFGYAGSRTPKLRIPDDARQRLGLGWSFPAREWRSYAYWYRLPDRLPRG